MHWVVPDEFDTTGVCCKISSDETGALRTEVNRYFIASNFSIVLQVTQNAASFGRDDAVWLIETNNLVHSLCAQDNLVMDWNWSTDKTSSTALRNDGQLSFIAVLKNCTNVSCCVWLKHDLRVTLVFLGPVSVVDLQEIFICYDSLVAKDSLEEGEVFSAESVVDWASQSFLWLDKLSFSNCTEHCLRLFFILSF